MSNSLTDKRALHTDASSNEKLWVCLSRSLKQATVKPIMWYRAIEARRTEEDSQYTKLVRKVTSGIETIVSLLYLFTLGLGVFPVKSVTWAFVVLAPWPISILSHLLVSSYFILRLAVFVLPVLGFVHFTKGFIGYGTLLWIAGETLACLFGLFIVFYTIDCCVRGPPWRPRIVEEDGQLLEEPLEDTPVSV